MSETFHFWRIASDREGYYYDRWDRAVPIAVTAEDQPRAEQKAFALSGQPPRGRFWKLRLDRIEAAGDPR